MEDFYNILGLLNWSVMLEKKETVTHMYLLQEKLQEEQEIMLDGGSLG